MPTTDTTEARELRIYCLCGQKMKVSPSMFGRPGKCVACRQKIRVPRQDEIDDDCSEIHLRDHPEFLRKSKSRRAPVKIAVQEALPDAALDVVENVESEDISLGDESESDTPSTPLDIFEPLQVLCSLEEKVQRGVQEIRNVPAGPARSRDKSALLGYKSLVRGARAALEEKLRDRLHAVTNQLTDTKDQIARAALALRVGEYDYPTYQRHMNSLRHRRDRLARRRENLVGWLHTQDPYMAGGLLDVSFDDIPVEAAEVTFPLEAPPDGAPINERITALRDALAWREEADLKTREVGRMRKEDALSDVGSGAPESAEQANALRARADVAFSRDRLRQLMRDLDDDNKAIRAHLEVVRRRVESGELGKSAYQSLEVELLQAQSDNNRARALAERALNANSVQDVPTPSGTFINRMMAPTVSARGLGLDSFVAWVAAGLLLINIFAPVTAGQAGSNMALLPGMVTGLFVSAILLVLAGAVPFRTTRGVLLNLLWVGTTLAMAYTANEARFLLDPVGVAIRSDPRWFMAPGILMMVLGALVMGLAASLSLMNAPRWRSLPTVCAILVVAGMVVFLSNFGGAMVAKPILDEPVSKPSPDAPARYASVIGLRNDGWRSMWLGEVDPKVPTPVMFALERRIGANSWKELLAPNEIVQEGHTWHPMRDNMLPMVEVAPGEVVRLHYVLDPGTYRVSVRATGGVRLSPVSHEMTLAPLVSEEAEEEPPAPTAVFESSPAAGTDAVVEDVAPVSSRAIELRGILNSAQRTPRFVLMVTTEDGRQRKQYVDLGAEIVGGWRAEEFNPGTQSLTVAKEGEILVLNSGEILPLP